MQREASAYRPRYSKQKTPFLGSSYLVELGSMVGGEGLEPSCLAAPAPKAGVSANFTTRPKFQRNLDKITTSGRENQPELGKGEFIS